LTATSSAAFQAEMVCPNAETVCLVTGHFFFQRPIAASANIFIDQTYRYGATEDDKREPHHGIDFPNKQGTPVLAAGDGQVVVAGNDKLTLYGWVTSFYGNLVVIEHSLPGFTQPVYTLYGHLYKVDVAVGQQVRAGEQVGEVGATGIAIGSHLHLEVRIGADTYKSTRNPELWVQPPPGMGVLAGRVLDAQGNPVKGTINIQRMQGDVILKDPIYQIETYARESLNGDDVLHENFAIGELAAGEYRLTLIYYGKVIEQRVQIEPGKLTLVLFSDQ
jgi:murein DD-endopeptidase MepM/ murein hydrolase activator NlpD